MAVFSTAVNLLTLTGSLYMLQVYDRVLSGRSVPTLVGLSLIAFAAFALQGVLDAMRLKLLGRIGARFDELLSPLTIRAAMLLPLRGATQPEAMQPVRDLESVRAFMGSLGPTALIDMPFLPVFLLGCFLLHPALALLAIVGATMIVGMTLLTSWRTTAPSQTLSRSASERASLAEACRRNAALIAAMGVRDTFAARFTTAHARYISDNLALSEVSGDIGSAAKVARYALQSGVLGLGAYLVIHDQMSGGSMLAASVLTSRALAPVELAVAHWKAFTGARLGYERLAAVLPAFERVDKAVSLPPPRASLSVSGLAVASRHTGAAVLHGVTFELRAGEALGLIGPSGSGKSMLARALVGVASIARGDIRLDGAATHQWDADELGRSIGYLPQDVELFEGTIAENIARFSTADPPDAVLEAARIAGAHEMIVALADGYGARVGEGGGALSGGQRQRIALARALYGAPFLVVLDEPNASLDAEGDRALAGAIASVKARGGIAVVITHRPSGLEGVDRVAVLREGAIQMIGPREDVLVRMAGATQGPTPPPPRVRPDPRADSLRETRGEAGRPLAAEPRVVNG